MGVTPAIVWYYQGEQSVLGPIDSAQLLKLARSGQILPETAVRSGEDGKWVRAAKIRNLFPSTPATVASEPSVAPATEGTAAASAGSQASIPPLVPIETIPVSFGQWYKLSTRGRGRGSILVFKDGIGFEQAPIPEAVGQHEFARVAVRHVGGSRVDISIQGPEAADGETFPVWFATRTEAQRFCALSDWPVEVPFERLTREWCVSRHGVQLSATQASVLGWGVAILGFYLWFWELDGLDMIQLANGEWWRVVTANVAPEFDLTERNPVGTVFQFVIEVLAFVTLAKVVGLAYGSALRIIGLITGLLVFSAAAYPLQPWNESIAGVEGVELMWGGMAYAALRHCGSTMPAQVRKGCKLALVLTIVAAFGDRLLTGLATYLFRGEFYLPSFIPFVLGATASSAVGFMIGHLANRKRSPAYATAGGACVLACIVLALLGASAHALLARFTTALEERTRGTQSADFGEVITELAQHLPRDPDVCVMRANLALEAGSITGFADAYRACWAELSDETVTVAEFQFFQFGLFRDPDQTADQILATVVKYNPTLKRYRELGTSLRQAATPQHQLSALQAWANQYGHRPNSACMITLVPVMESWFIKQASGDGPGIDAAGLNGFWDLLGLRPRTPEPDQPMQFLFKLRTACDLINNGQPAEAKAHFEALAQQPIEPLQRAVVLAFLESFK